jgi:hypothetical protein
MVNSGACFPDSMVNALDALADDKRGPGSAIMHDWRYAYKRMPLQGETQPMSNFAADINHGPAGFQLHTHSQAGPLKQGQLIRRSGRHFVRRASDERHRELRPAAAFPICKDDHFLVQKASEIQGVTYACRFRMLPFD